MNFPPDLQKNLDAGEISYGSCLVVRFLEKNDRAALCGFLKTLRPGANRMKEIAENLLEISKRDGIPVKSILEKKEIREIILSKAGRKQKTEQVRKFIKHLRYPLLTKKEQEINSKIFSLKLPKNVKLKYPENFEGDHLCLEIKFRKSAELKTLINEIAGKKKTLDELLKLL